MKFAGTKTCTCRAHCRTCRARTEAGIAWRASIASVFTPPAKWICPHGVPWDVGEALHTRLLRKAKLGNAVERAARAAGVQPCGGCRRRKALLNGEPRNTAKP